MPLPFTLGLAGAAALAGWWGYRQASARRRQEAEHQGLEETNAELRDDLHATRDQLLEVRRLASLGHLSAGIAHEIKNPLNFVNNFAQLSIELAAELREELEAHPERRVADVLDEVRELLGDLAHNADKITEHGQRADRIVRTMLMHARSNASQRRPTDLNVLVLDYVGLAYHGMRAATPDFNVTIVKDLDPDLGEVPVAPQEIGRVVINLLDNAFHAVHERVGTDDYTPTVTISARDLGEAVELRVADNGPGIPAALRERIFEPFFTTRPAGKGTGLGLSLSHEIVTKSHGGTMAVESVEGEGTTFVVTLPREVDEGEATDG